MKMLCIKCELCIFPLDLYQCEIFLAYIVFSFLCHKCLFIKSIYYSIKLKMASVVFI